MYPLKFKPILKQTIWGGDRIIPFKGLHENLKNVGESWELSGVPDHESEVANGEFAGRTLRELINEFREELVGESVYKRFSTTFPLLIKFIDARQDLSIQVHPNDELAKMRHNSLGKTEMWYVMDAAEGAKLRSGFAKKVTPREYKDSVANSTITDLLCEYEIHPGDVFFLPAGRIHSIGAGAFIAEIQETSDITYRIFDFNRKDANGNTRELHTELAKDAIDYEVQDDYRTHYTPVVNEPVELVSCPYFTTSVYDLTDEITCDYAELDSFVVLICMDGKATIFDNDGHEEHIHAGETVLLAASTQEVRIVPDGSVKILETYV